MNRSHHIKLPPEAELVINKLNLSGFEAYAVGGCVRDGILGRVPEDWDIATNALPSQIKEAFDRTVDTGIKHGTVTALVNDADIEITTYRVDGIYKDSRHPENVDFTSSLEEDLKRRDFTMNAIAYHPEHGIIDPFGGIADIASGLIRTVGRPEERFAEDALRMLRAVRFSAQLGFDIHEDVLEAIIKNNNNIEKISNERIRDELTKLLVSDNSMRFILLWDTDLLRFILPEFEKCFYTSQQNPYHIYNVAIHSLKVVTSVPNNKVLRWAALLHDIGKPLVKTTDDNGIDHFYGHQAKGAELAETIMKRLRFDNNSINLVTKLVNYHDVDIHPTNKAVRKAAAKMGKELFEDLLSLKEGDRKAQAPQYLEEGLDGIRMVRRLYSEIIRKNEVLTLKELAVNGNDLINLGYKPGPELRFILEKLLESVLDEPELNTREKLLELSGKWYLSEQEL